MRSLVASALLFFQLHPFLGVALCNALGGAEGERMEAGCPMPEAGSAPRNSVFATWSAPVSSRECVFTEACAPAPTVVIPVYRGGLSLPERFDAPVQPSGLPLLVHGRSPPVPPPKA